MIRDIVASVLESLPQDPTLSEENLFMALCSNQIGEVIKRANEIDIWLAAHMADMMHPLGLLVESEESVLPP
jgi:nuclear pore complex protein Nup85